MRDIGFLQEFPDDEAAARFPPPRRAGASPFTGRGSRDGNWRDLLARLVVSRVIPELKASVPATGAGAAAQTQGSMTAVAELTRRLLSKDTAEARAYVADLQRRKFSQARILVDLFGPAARKLGDLWVADKCDFVAVTLGVSRLKGLTAEFCGDDSAPGPSVRRAPRVLLSPCPGEAHDFGIVTISHFLQADGWAVTRANPDNLMDRLATEPFEVMGLSISSERNAGRLESSISAIRKASINPDIRIMLGGSLIAGDPAIAAGLHTDGTAIDAKGAVLLARFLLDGAKV
jgi:methanogenic corrinoid protein MtbC1